MTPIPNTSESSPVASETLSLLEDKVILQTLMNILTKERPKNYDVLPYHEKIKIDTVKSQIIKVLEYQIKTVG